jgi:hypothetical protein
MEAAEDVRVKFSNSAAKGKGVVEQFVAAGGRPIGLPLLGKAEICERTGHKNAQPTHPERNAQAPISTCHPKMIRSRCIIATMRNSVAVTVM